MFQILIILIVFAATLTSSALAQFEIPAIDVPIYYDPATGNVTMDATHVPSGQLFSYKFAFSLRGGHDPAPTGLPSIRSEEFTPFMETLWYSPNQWSVGETNFSGIPAGVYSLGSILPPGLSRETGHQIADWLDQARDSRDFQVLDELGRWGHYWDFIFGKSPFEPLNGDESWAPTYDRWAESVTLLYDETNGELAIDSTGDGGGALSAFGLQFREEAPVSPDNWTPMGDVSGFDEGLLTEFFTSGLPEGRYDLGRLLPTGLTTDEVSDLFESSLFVGQPGHTSPFSLDVHGEPFQISVVPEPSGIGLAILALSCLSRARRHRRTRGGTYNE